MHSDPERLFECLRAEDWPGALAVVRAAPAAWTRQDPVAAGACALLVERLEQALRSGDPGPGPDALEMVIMLGRSGRLPVSRPVEACVIERLLTCLRDEPGRALSVARFRPDLPACAAIIAQFGIPERRVESSGPLEVSTAELTHGTVAAGRSVFRSPGERALHEAAVRAWPGLFVLPNVALNAALDYERLRARLTAAERRVFFTALVDCVAFDPASGYRPVHFVELDSTVHDDARRAGRDDVKDRIVALAGYRLVRLRPEVATDDPEAFAAVLRALGRSGA